MAFIASCFRWPSYRSTTSSTIITSTAIHNHYLAYIPTHYLHRNIQQHIRMYANNNTVCCIHLTNYLHFLSQSSHTEGQRHPLVRAALTILTDGDVAGPACLDRPRCFVLVTVQKTICYNIWRNPVCDKYVYNMCVSGTLLFCLCLYFTFVQMCRSSQVCVCVCITLLAFLLLS